jgi:hypothetical protein
MQLLIYIQTYIDNILISRKYSSFFLDKGIANGAKNIPTFYIGAKVYLLAQDRLFSSFFLFPPFFLFFFSFSSFSPSLARNKKKGRAFIAFLSFPSRFLFFFPSYLEFFSFAAFL